MPAKLPGWVVDDVTSVREEVAAWRDLTPAERWRLAELCARAGAPPTRARVGQVMRWRRSAAAIAALTAAGCSDRSCAIEDVLEDRIGAANVEDCGDLGFDADLATFEAAHDCVLAHADVEGEFVVRWEIPGSDSHLVHGYVGVTEIDGYHLYALRYDGDPGGGGGDGDPLTVTSSCTSITDLDPCLDQPYSNCLACQGAVEVDRCDSD